MDAALLQVDAAELAAVVVNREGAALAAAVVGQLAEAIGDPPRRRGQRPCALVVGAHDGEPVRGQPRDELAEQGLHPFDVFEVVGVVELDVGDERPLRVVKDEVPSDSSTSATSR